jgi:DNA-binding Lrp family transcriptional regulator
MKHIELKLVSELMKNSRRSDRELAKAIGVSQPTVSRTIAKLEKDGVLKEWTVIPDFNKLGYQICALILQILKRPLSCKRARALSVPKTYMARASLCR